MELFYGVNENRDTDPLCVEASVNSQLSQLDRGFLSWIVTAFKITLVLIRELPSVALISG